MRCFISYSHKQSEWVWKRLVPCVKAGGVDILIDRERFKAGITVKGQMDNTQDQADKHLLVLTRDYLNSDYCRHEMKRAIDWDQEFTKGLVIPIVRGDCTLPRLIKGSRQPLWVDLRNDGDEQQWRLLLDQCEANVGIGVPKWLDARDKAARLLERNESVNLVVSSKIAWRGLIEDFKARYFPDMALVNLEHPATITRRGLLSEILKGLGQRPNLPDEPNDLPAFHRILSGGPTVRAALIHFDMVPYKYNYDVNLFAAIRYSVMDTRELVLLVQSHTPFHALLPVDHPLSPLDLKNIELRGPE